MINDLEIVSFCPSISILGVCGVLIDSFGKQPYDWMPVETVQTAQLDPESFAQLFESARPALRVVAGSECGFEHADDVVQHGAVIALEQLDKFTPGTNFTAWTAAIVRGVARNQRRFEQRRVDHRPKLALFISQRHKQHQKDTNASRSRPSESTTEVEIPAEFDARLKNALGTLSEEQRACLLLKTLLEHSYNEIGEILNIPPATARSHVYRARLQLLDRLDRPNTKGASS